MLLAKSVAQTGYTFLTKSEFPIFFYDILLYIRRGHQKKGFASKGKCEPGLNERDLRIFRLQAFAAGFL